MKILVIIAFFIIALRGMQYLYRSRWNKSLDVDIFFEQNYVFEGDEALVCESVTNRKLLILPVLMIKYQTDPYVRFVTSGEEDNDSEFIFNDSMSDYIYKNDYVSILSYQAKKRHLPIRCVHRGYCSINSYTLVGFDLFLGNKMITKSDCFSELYIFPKLINARDFDMRFNSLMGDVITKRYINEDPFTFKGIRDYQSYDSMRQINWGASAKSMNLMVNQYDNTSSLQVTIMLNLDRISGLRDDELDETSISLAATLTDRLCSLGIPVSFITNAKDNYTGNSIKIGHGCGQEHIKNILMSLSKIGVYKNAPDDFSSMLSHEIITSSLNTWIFVISQTTNSALSMAISKNIESVRLIVPSRKSTLDKIPDNLKAITTIWTLS